MIWGYGVNMDMFHRTETTIGYRCFEVYIAEQNSAMSTWHVGPRGRWTVTIWESNTTAETAKKHFWSNSDCSCLNRSYYVQNDSALEFPGKKQVCATNDNNVWKPYRLQYLRQDLSLRQPNLQESHNQDDEILHLLILSENIRKDVCHTTVEKAGRKTFKVTLALDSGVYYNTLEQVFVYSIQTSTIILSRITFVNDDCAGRGTLEMTTKGVKVTIL